MREVAQRDADSHLMCDSCFHADLNFAQEWLSLVQRQQENEHIADAEWAAIAHSGVQAFCEVMADLSEHCYALKSVTLAEAVIKATASIEGMREDRRRYLTAVIEMRLQDEM
jgi:hypothetical protein